MLDVSIQRSWNRDGNHSFPLATLVINGVASLCAGIAMMSYYAQSVDMGTVMTFVVGVPRRILNILVGDQRGAVADSQTPFRHGPGLSALPRSRCRSPAWRSDSASPCWAATHSCHRLSLA